MNIKAILSSFVVVCIMSVCGSGSKMVLREVPRESRQGLMVLNFKNNTKKSKAREFKPWEYGLASMMMADIESKP